MNKTSSSREKMITVKFYTNYLSRMMMPNLSIFIAWMLISFLLPFFSVDQQVIQQMEQGVLTVLLPLMIAYTGGQMLAPERGGVVGAVAVLGAILATDIPQVFGAMLLGPLAGWLLYRSDSIVSKVKSGYEMLVRNFIAGAFGGLLFLGSYFLLAPLFNWFSLGSYQLVDYFVQQNVLPFIHIIVEPLKVLFFNNIVNHGLFTPLGIEAAVLNGQSVLFLIEANPGPGLGVLAAYLFLGSKRNRTNAAASVFVQAIGGIHEVYFPFVLLDPWVLLGPIIGGFSGTLIFQFLGVGLRAPASPGSILAILLNTPPSMILGVLAGIIVSTVVSFAIASVLLKRKSNTENEERKMPKMKKVTEIVVACDAGMGSSAIGASILKKQLQEAQLTFPVRYQSIYRVTDDPALLVITQRELAAIAQKQTPHAQHYVLDNFLAADEYAPLIKELQRREQDPQKSLQTEGASSLGFSTIIFLYTGKKRGSQTMAVEILSKMARQQALSLTIKKMAYEGQALDPTAVYILPKELAEKCPIPDVPLLVVDDLLTTDAYRQLLTEGVDYVFDQS